MGQSLTGQQINNTYQGLLKTTDSLALPAGKTAITDGDGVESGLFIWKEYNTIGLSGTALPNEGAYLELQNNGFTLANSPMGTGADTAIWLTDVNGATTYRMEQNAQGSMTFNQVKVGQEHIFAGGQISMNSFSSPSNSTNWFTGYQQSVTDLQIAGQDLTLSRQGTPDLTVTLPSGGGGAAGLVSGTGTDSMKSADTLTTNAASAPTTNSIAIGNGATIAPADPARPTWELGHIAIGENVNITENSFGNFYSRSCIAIGKNAQVNPYYDGGNVALGDGANSNNMHGIAIGANTTAGQFAVSMGQNAIASAESTFALGRNANASTLNAVAIGASTNSSGN